MSARDVPTEHSNNVDDLIKEAITDTENYVHMKIHVATSKGKSRLKAMSTRGIEVDIAAPAVDGRANRAVISLFSEVFGVKSARIEIASGEHSRSKVVAIDGTSKDQAERALRTALKI
ncbi:MAG: DUF167 domain-containing protein [Actinomycetota bacterium]|nr:DUF167 domain-containing protein [Actinomycetota bacterium]